MLRHSLLLVAGTLAVASAGCTHCDTCDDFPIPCVGPNCGPLSGQGSYTPAGRRSAPRYTVPAGPGVEPAAG